MKKQLITALILGALAPAVWATPITAIMGNGIQPDNWTATQSGNLQLALRAKYRAGFWGANDYQVPVPVGTTYSFSAGNVGPRGPFNYEFSINSDTSGGGAALSTYTYQLLVDRDASAGIVWSTVSPLFKWGDNSYGNNGTAQSQGLEPVDLATYNSYPTIYNIAQNSQNITFGDYPGGALALVADATYDYMLIAFNANGVEAGRVGITVVTGNGGAAVPETGITLGMLGFSVVGLSMLRRKLIA